MTFLELSINAESRHRFQAGPHVLTVGLICFIASYATVMLTRGTHGIAVLWISNAVMLAAVLVRPSALLPLFLSGAAGIGTANLLAGDLPGTSLGFIAANGLNVLVGFALMRRFDAGRFEFGSPLFLARFLAICGIIGPAVSATVGAIVASRTFGTPYSAVWLSWFGSCSLGTIIVGPLLIAFWSPGVQSGSRLPDSRRRAALGTLALICLVNLVVFGTSRTAVPLLPFAAVVFATVLFGQKMASAGIVVSALAGLASLVAATGPLARFTSLDERVLMLQGFLAVLTLTCLPIAAVLRERQVLGDRLAVAEARHRLLSEGSGDAIPHFNHDGTVLHASRAATDLTGLTPDALVGQSGIDFVHPDDRAAVARTHRQVVACGGAATESYRDTHLRDGDERWLEARSRAILTGNEVSGVITTVRDVTLLAAQERRMAQEAATDPLTGLANRWYFMDRLVEALADGRSGPVAVAMLDIDHFKRFNDRHGHAAGDAVLCAVARAVDASLRTGDLIARFGGEEFAILFPDTGDKDALIMAGRVRCAAASQVVIFAGDALRVTISVGAAVSLPEVSDAATLLAAADARLYAAKSSGRNCVSLAA